MVSKLANSWVSEGRHRGLQSVRCRTNRFSVRYGHGLSNDHNVNGENHMKIQFLRSVVMSL